MIRKAKLTDFPLVYPILKQIFDEMDMNTIKALPESQFYDLMKHGFYSITLFNSLTFIILLLTLSYTN